MQGFFPQLRTSRPVLDSEAVKVKSLRTQQRLRMFGATNEVAFGDS